MNLYIGDFHFGHANVIKHDSRPFADVDEMDRVMMEHWNAAVNKDDEKQFVCSQETATASITSTADSYCRNGRIDGRSRF